MSDESQNACSEPDAQTAKQDSACGEPGMEAEIAREFDKFLERRNEVRRKNKSRRVGALNMN